MVDVIQHSAQYVLDKTATLLAIHELTVQGERLSREIDRVTKKVNAHLTAEALSVAELRQISFDLEMLQTIVQRELQARQGKQIRNLQQSES